MSERRVVTMGAVVGAMVGVTAAYLFFTDRGRVFRDRLEPFVDDLRQEFTRFQRTLEKVGDMANEGVRVVQEFNTARAQAHFPGVRTPH